MTVKGMAVGKGRVRFLVNISGSWAETQICRALQGTIAISKVIEKAIQRISKLLSMTLMLLLVLRIRLKVELLV